MRLRVWSIVNVPVLLVRLPKWVKEPMLNSSCDCPAAGGVCTSSDDVRLPDNRHVRHAVCWVIAHSVTLYMCCGLGGFQNGGKRMIDSALRFSTLSIDRADHSAKHSAIAPVVIRPTNLFVMSRCLTKT